jgi:hypothetical protein
MARSAEKAQILQTISFLENIKNQLLFFFILIIQQIIAEIIFTTTNYFVGNIDSDEFGYWRLHYILIVLNGISYCLMLYGVALSVKRALKE